MVTAVTQQQNVEAEESAIRKSGPRARAPPPKHCHSNPPRRPEMKMPRHKQQQQNDHQTSKEDHHNQPTDIRTTASNAQSDHFGDIRKSRPANECE